MTKAGFDPVFSGIFAVLMTALACGYVVLTMPRPVVPRDLPTLVLDREAVQEQLAADRSLAASAPDSEQIRKLYQAYIEEGLAERGDAAEQGRTAGRQQRMERLAEVVFSEIGARNIDALRARAVERYELATHDLIHDRDERDGLLARFDRQLRQYGLVDARGTRIAPRLAIRSVYKARWNLVHGLPTSTGLTPIEVQAFEGWIALHASSAPKARRIKAAQLFQGAGGHDGQEALALWLLETPNKQAARALLIEMRDRGELRARNYLLALEPDWL